MSAPKVEPVRVQGQNDTSFQYWQQGSGPFKYTDHYISNTSGIILSLYSTPESLRNFAPNFRGIAPERRPFNPATFEAWTIEYFCEPDYVLTAFDANGATNLYLNRLKWEKSLWFDRHKNRLLLTYHHRPEAGFISEAMTADQRADAANLDTEIVIQFQWYADDHHVEVRVDLINRAKLAKDYIFVAQDAAYLWFPNQKQINLERFLFKEKQILNQPYVMEKGIAKSFAGIYSKQHGIFSGFGYLRTGRPANVTVKTSLGTSNYYLLVPKDVPIGYQLIPADQGRDFANLIQKSQDDKSGLLNRYAAFQLGDVRTDQKCVLTFKLIMGLTQPNQSLEDRITEVLAGF